MLQRVRTAWRTVAGLWPPTPGGLLLVAGSAAALWAYGLGRQDVVLLAIGALGLSVWGLGTLVAVAAALVAWRRTRALPPQPTLELECGHPGRTGFGLRPPWFLPFTWVRWTWEQPRAHLRLVPEGPGYTEQITPLRRGEHEHLVRRVEVGDSFGVARVAFCFTEARRARFTPYTGGLDKVHVVQGLAGGDSLSHPEGSPTGDRLDLRHYGHGDPIRFVLWKVFARTRQLVVRTPERALSPARQTVAYLVSGPGDEAAAGTARVAVAGGALGESWVLGADGNPDVATTPAQALDLIVRSAHAPPEDAGAGLSGFLEQASRGSVRRAVLFVPPRPGPWLDRVASTARAAQASGISLDVVVCVDGVEPARGRALASRALLRAPDAPPGPEPAHRVPLRQVLRTLTGLQGQVMVVDRSTATVHPSSHLRHLLGGP